MILISLLLALASSQEITHQQCGLQEQPPVWKHCSSNPVCIDQLYNVIFSCCNYHCTGKDCWTFSEPCPLFQTTPSFCPQGFLSYSNSLCAFIIENTTFPPACPYGEPEPFLIQTKKSHWMPVRRIYNLLYWTEVSERFLTPFNLAYTYSKPILGKDCIVKHKDYYEAVSCEEYFQAQCVYQRLDLKKDLDNVCTRKDPDCFQVDFDQTCFCSSSEGEPVEVLKPYQNYPIQAFLKQSCLINLQRRNDRFFWPESNLELDYSFWSPDITQGGDLVVMGPTGWELRQGFDGCLISALHLNWTKSSLYLYYQNSKLFLNVTNQKDLYYSNQAPLILCYSDAAPDQLLTKVKVDLKNGPYSVDMLKAPGNYFCVAFQEPLREVIYSNTVLVHPKEYTDEFVVFFKINYGEDENPLSFEFVEKLSKLVNDTLNKGNFFGRIFDIVYENETTVVVNSHMTASISGNRNGSDGRIKRVLEESGLQWSEFYASGYCFWTSSVGFDKILLWPVTDINCFAYPHVPCVTGSGKLLTRRCGGNFTAGARWEEIDLDCVIYQMSEVSEKIYSLFKTGINLRELLVIVEGDLGKFQALDVFLTCKVLEVQKKQPFISLKILNMILDLDREVLKEFQRFPKSDNIIFKLIERAILVLEDGQIPLFRHFGAVEVKGGSQGVLVKNRNGIREISLIGSDIDISKLEVMEDLEAVLVFSFGLEDFKGSILVVIYFTEDLFVVEGVSFDVNMIFKVKVPDYKVFFHSTLAVRSVRTGICSSWSSRNLGVLGGWRNCTRAQDVGSLRLCHFTEINPFTIISSDNHFTEELEDIYKSNISIPEKMNMVANISASFDLLESEDLSLIADILHQAVETAEVLLLQVSEIVKNLVQVSKDKLVESQNTYAATDRILHHVDELLKRADKSKKFYFISSSFLLLSLDLKTANAKGIVLRNCEKECDIEDIPDGTEMEDLSDYPDADAFVLLSEAVLRQARNWNNSVLIVAVYRTNSIFVETKSNSNTSTVLDVILPGQEESLNGIISIVYNTTLTGFGSNCVHWNYQVENNTVTEKGVWKSDSHPNGDSGSLTICNYNHLTHFALLLADNDAIFGKIDPSHILDMITIINCCLSLIGVLGIITTALLFPKWRKNTGNHILLNFIFSLSLKIVLLYLNDSMSEVQEDWICILNGALLHYSFLSEFCWMLIIALLQFKRFVEVLGGPPKYILLKAYICGWILPALPVGCLLAVDPYNYTHSKVSLCYPTGLGLYLGVWIPIAIVVCINTIIFIFILYNVCYNKTECRDVVKTEHLFQWQLALLLFFMLGLTWLFAFLSIFNFGVAFAYLFTFTSTLQGFIMFLFFILFNKSTRVLYSTAFKKWLYNK